LTGPNEYGIKVIANNFMDNIRALHSNAIAKSNEDKLEASAQITKMKDKLEYEPVAVKILNDGSASMPELNKRLVRIDHFVSSPKHQQIVLGEIAKLKEIEEYIAALEPKVDTDLSDYHNALFTGSLSLSIPNIEYEDEFGSVTVLSSPDMQRGGVPLYQGLLSFKELGEDIREAVKEATEQTLRTSPLPEKAVSSCRAVNDEMKNVKFMIEEATEVFPREVKDVREFLSKTKDTLARFARRYRIEL